MPSTLDKIVEELCELDEHEQDVRIVGLFGDWMDRRGLNSFEEQPTYLPHPVEYRWFRWVLERHYQNGQGTTVWDRSRFSLCVYLTQRVLHLQPYNKIRFRLEVLNLGVEWFKWMLGHQLEWLTLNYASTVATVCKDAETTLTPEFLDCSALVFTRLEEFVRYTCRYSHVENLLALYRVLFHSGEQCLTPAQRGLFPDFRRLSLCYLLRSLLQPSEGPPWKFPRDPHGKTSRVPPGQTLGTPSGTSLN